MSGCQPIIQSGLPDPALTARDKQMMALAEPDEYSIPTHRSKITYQTNEQPGTIIVDTSYELSLLCPARMAKRFNTESPAAPSIWGGPAALPWAR